MTATKPAATDEPLTVLDARVQARDAVLKAKGFKEGLQEARAAALERVRNLLRRQAKQKFGAAPTAHVDRYLAAVREFEGLLEFGDWLVDCASGPELLDRIKAAR